MSSSPTDYPTPKMKWDLTTISTRELLQMQALLTVMGAKAYDRLRHWPDEHSKGLCLVLDSARYMLQFPREGGWFQIDKAIKGALHPWGYYIDWRANTHPKANAKATIQDTALSRIAWADDMLTQVNEELRCPTRSPK
jgi:hypothetical protein